MTAEEIKAALDNCSHDFCDDGVNRCIGCPASFDVTGEDCSWYMPKMALAYIRELEAGAMKKEETK